MFRRRWIAFCLLEIFLMVRLKHSGVLVNERWEESQMGGTVNRIGWRRFLVGLMLAALVLGVGSAVAEEATTRQDYVTQLEGVCKPDAEATQRAMKGARSDIQAERFDVAAGKFAKATRIFGSTVDEIAPISRPSEDKKRLGKWFVYLRKQESYLSQITSQLRADHGIKAQRLIARFIHSGNLANNVVLAFGFNYCSFKFSRYG